MDVKLYMIVDLEKKDERQMFITARVASINKKVNSSLWLVRFGGSSKEFKYNPSRLLFLYEPAKINLDGKALYIENERICGTQDILCFSDGRHTFYHITWANGKYSDYPAGKVYISRTRIDANGGDTWHYLRKLADETGLISDDDENILSKQYDLVDVNRTNVPLYQYIDRSRKLSTFNKPSQIYYPFGCNASQKAAVEAALSNQLSIIQGPPGTGKTQTILNIIANLLMNGKSVLVVSNNNSAVDNVSEKMAKVGLGFLIAKLGSVENKKAFLESQTEFPDISEWLLDATEPVQQLSQESLQALSLAFDSQTAIAKLQSEYDGLILETRYNDILQGKTPLCEFMSRISARKLLQLLNQYQRIIENNGIPSRFFRLRWALSASFRLYRFLNLSPSFVVEQLTKGYYVVKKAELDDRLRFFKDKLKGIDIKMSAENLTAASLQMLRHKIAKSIKGRKRNVYTINDIKFKTKVFLKEYPVVLSTTYSAKSCISKNMVFDYVIMDEASQVDVKTGALSLSCAMNAVIVGDDKQLPNVVDREEKLALDAIRSAFSVGEEYNAATHSFLRSCSEVFGSAPSTLLREHYRCHPKIIEFCNHRFYDDELIPMTVDNNEKDVLLAIQTVPGAHARGHFNQREIDVISQEVMPLLGTGKSVGIITPYNVQAQEINKALNMDIASTVHKFQGRECDTIIMSMVDNQPTEFSDDSNLINVAVSRAKNRLVIVTNGNEMDPDTNIAQLIEYMRYNNFEVRESRLRSVFDLLYKQYTDERLAYESKHRRVSEYMSENLIYDLITRALAELRLVNVSVICHYPLSRLVSDFDKLDDQEKQFAESPYAHVDFLIYNTITKQPRTVIEVDGWQFHKDQEVQQRRDELKDHILSKFDLPLHRISTTDTISKETIKNILS